MSGFICGADRGQGTMFPAQLEDYVAEDNPVRVIDFFVDQLDLAEVGFGASIRRRPEGLATTQQ
jgi:transposase